MVVEAAPTALWDPAFFASMDRLLKPRSFAVIGASPNPSFVSGILNNAIAHAFDPTHASRGGLGYVTVAVGADYSDVAPTSGSYRSGARGTLTAIKRVSLVELE